MKVLVVGAAGKTGRAVVERAVKEGHEVTAFVHSTAGYDVPGVEVQAGDATDMAAAEAADTPFYVKISLATYLRGATPDKAKMESAVTGSELDWVTTRPAILTEKPATGDVRIFAAGNRNKAHSITRSDLAAFLVAQLTSDDHLRRAVTIANR
jgi:uncharacterized protein YbjT (DUF2867 family)